MLEVVEQQQDPRVFEVASQAIQQRPVAHVPQPDTLRDRRRDQIRVPDRGQRHEIHPVREPAGDFGSQLEAKPGLAAAARARESQQAAAFQECLQILQLPLPADEAGQLAWQVIGKPIQRARRGHAAIITPKLIPQTAREPLTDRLRYQRPACCAGSSGSLPVTARERNSGSGGRYPTEPPFRGPYQVPPLAPRPRRVKACGHPARDAPSPAGPRASRPAATAAGRLLYGDWSQACRIGRSNRRRLRGSACALGWIAGGHRQGGGGHLPRALRPDSPGSCRLNGVRWSQEREGRAELASSA